MLREVRGRRGGLGPWERKVTKARDQERTREELSACDGHGAREGEGDGEVPAASPRCEMRPGPWLSVPGERGKWRGGRVRGRQRESPEGGGRPGSAGESRELKAKAGSSGDTWPEPKAVWRPEGGGRWAARPWATAPSAGLRTEAGPVWPAEQKAQGAAPRRSRLSCSIPTSLPELRVSSLRILSPFLKDYKVGEKSRSQRPHEDGVRRRLRLPGPAWRGV